MARFRLSFTTLVTSLALLLIATNDASAEIIAEPEELQEELTIGVTTSPVQESTGERTEIALDIRLTADTTAIYCPLDDTMVFEDIYLAYLPNSGVSVVEIDEYWSLELGANTVVDAGRMDSGMERTVRARLNVDEAAMDKPLATIAVSYHDTIGDRKMTEYFEAVID